MQIVRRHNTAVALPNLVEQNIFPVERKWTRSGEASFGSPETRRR
jgi:hypothetical protein